MLTYSARLRGVGFRGPDITNIVRLLEPGDLMSIEPEFDNKYDPNAIKVILTQGEDEHFLGYIGKEWAADIAPQLKDENEDLLDGEDMPEVHVFFLKQDADKKGKPHPLIFVCICDEGEDPDTARAYFDDELALFETSDEE